MKIAVTFDIFLEDPLGYAREHINWENFGVTFYAAILFFSMYVAARVLIPILVNIHPRLKDAYEKMSSYEKKHQCQVLVSLIHAIWATISSFYYIYTIKFSLQSYESQICVYNFDPIPRFILQVALGYFFADLTAYYFTGINASAYLSIFHHVIIIYAYSYCLITHIATFPESAFLACELSTIFLHVRYFMKEYNLLTETFMYPLTQLLFAFTFFLVRILYSSFVTFGIYDCVLVSMKPDLPGYQVGQLMICATLFFVLQWVWFYKIVQILANKLFGGKKKKVE